MEQTTKKRKFSEFLVRNKDFSDLPDEIHVILIKMIEETNILLLMKTLALITTFHSKFISGNEKIWELVFVKLMELMGQNITQKILDNIKLHFEDFIDNEKHSRSEAAFWKLYTEHVLSFDKFPALTSLGKIDLTSIVDKQIAPKNIFFSREDGVSNPWYLKKIRETFGRYLLYTYPLEYVPEGGRKRGQNMPRKEYYNGGLVVYDIISKKIVDQKIYDNEIEYVKLLDNGTLCVVTTPNQPIFTLEKGVVISPQVFSGLTNIRKRVYHVEIYERFFQNVKKLKYIDRSAFFLRRPITFAMVPDGKIPGVRYSQEDDDLVYPDFTFENNYGEKYKLGLITSFAFSNNLLIMAYSTIADVEKNPKIKLVTNVDKNAPELDIIVKIYEWKLISMRRSLSIVKRISLRETLDFDIHRGLITPFYPSKLLLTRENEPKFLSFSLLHPDNGLHIVDNDYKQLLYILPFVGKLKAFGQTINVKTIRPPLILYDIKNNVAEPRRPGVLDNMDIGFTNVYSTDLIDYELTLFPLNAFRMKYVNQDFTARRFVMVPGYDNERRDETYQHSDAITELNFDKTIVVSRFFAGVVWSPPSMTFGKGFTFNTHSIFSFPKSKETGEFLSPERKGQALFNPFKLRAAVEDSSFRKRGEKMDLGNLISHKLMKIWYSSGFVIAEFRAYGRNEETRSMKELHQYLVIFKTRPNGKLISSPIAAASVNNNSITGGIKRNYCANPQCRYSSQQCDISKNDDAAASCERNRMKIEWKICTNCYDAIYCGDICQQNHYNKNNSPVNSLSLDCFTNNTTTTL